VQSLARRLLDFENLFAETVELLISQGHREEDILEYSIPKALFYREKSIRRINIINGAGEKSQKK
jgi:hypothetical protein